MNLGHMDWETLSVFPGNPNQKQHQQFLDVINDNSLTQVVKKTTGKDKTLDLILTNYPITVNKVETLPPIADWPWHCLYRMYNFLKKMPTKTKKNI